MNACARRRHLFVRMIICFFRNTFFFFDNSFCKAKKYPFLLKFFDFDFLLLFFGVISNVAKQKFCRSLRAIFGSGKKLRKKRFFYVLQIKLQFFELVVRERKKNATESWKTKEKAAAVQTRNKVPVFVAVSRSRCFYF